MNIPKNLYKKNPPSPGGLGKESKLESSSQSIKTVQFPSSYTKTKKPSKTFLKIIGRILAVALALASVEALLVSVPAKATSVSDITFVNSYPVLNGNYIDCYGNIDNDFSHHTLDVSDTDPAHHVGQNCPNGSLVWRALNSGTTSSSNTTTTSSVTTVSSPSTAGINSSANVTPNPVIVGQSASFTVKVTNGSSSLSNALVDAEIYNSAGQRILQQVYSGQNFSPSQVLSYQFGWVTSAADTFKVKVGVFNSAWSILYNWNDSALSFTASNPIAVQASVGFTSSASATPNPAVVSQPVNLTATVINSGTGINNGVTDVEIYNSAGQRVLQQVFSGQNFATGQTITDQWSWAPTTADTYKVKIGLFNSTWSTQYNWNDNALTFTVNAAAATPAPAPVTASSGNPLAGMNFYVNPNSPAAQDVSAWASSQHQNALLMNKIANHAVATWLGGWNSNVQSDANNVVTAAANSNTLALLVVYNIPQRDCGGYSAGGTTASGYQTWVRQIAAGIGSRKAVVILEPDALAQITCLSATDQQTRYQLLSDAVNVFKALGQTYVYLDAGHPNWISAADMASRLTIANVAHADGFALNVSNFYYTADNVSYGQQIAALIGNKHFVVDTSRNGLGPTPDNQWCNPLGRALGLPPTTATGSALADAYLWIKTPGESDGTCNGGPSAGTWWPDYALGLASLASW